MRRAKPYWPWCGLAVIVAITMSACSPSSLVDVQSPSTVVDPSTIQTVSGAIGLHTGAAAQLMFVLAGDPYNPGLIAASGLFTDELVDLAGSNRDLDQRNRGGDYWYINLQSARVKAALAREALHAYAPNTPVAPRAWQGEAYVWEGYSVLWLAELFCSGIPLSAVSLQGTPVPTRGFTTAELFQHAIADFDSAMVFGADSANYVNAARIGKGRALLGLGNFATADSVVAAVPTDFIYRLQADSSSGSIGQNLLPAQVVGASSYAIVDYEGGAGLPWSTDPRPGGVLQALPGYETSVMVPAKYNVTAAGTLDPSQAPKGVPFRLADGLEARLIQAEAALARGDASWLTVLNRLRVTCVGTSPCAPVPGLTAAAFATLIDPGTDSTRLDLLFRERAMWLYLTVHRVGDLRRFVNVYHRASATLWPTGQYTDLFNGIPDGNYSTSTVLTPGPEEASGNPLYGGCYNINS